MGFIKKYYWQPQPWIWILFASHWVNVLVVFFCKYGKLFAHLFNSHGDQLQWRTIIF